MGTSMKPKAKYSEADFRLLRTVHPRNVCHHGLFSEVFLKQHMIIDNNWTTASLEQQFKAFAKVLSTRMHFFQLNKVARSKRIKLQSRRLRKQCTEGRRKLKLITAGETSAILHLLKNNKEMRLLSRNNRMDPKTVLANINQKTFVMRKERDRLAFRFRQLKKIYGNKLDETNKIHSRILYENEFFLDEVIRIYELKKKIENQEIRLKGVKVINDTFKKITYTLKSDSKFYEHILSSLDQDLADQSLFINHIFHLCSPAMENFRKLEQQYAMTQKYVIKRREKETQESLPFIKRTKPSAADQRKSRSELFETLNCRETESMTVLKNQLEELDETIKTYKYNTLCTDPKDVYKRIKDQIKQSQDANRWIEMTNLDIDVLETKVKYASVLEEIVNHNFGSPHKKYVDKIEKLERAIKQEDNLQESTLAHIRNRSDINVLLRLVLWNIHDIMRYVVPIRSSVHSIPPYRSKDLSLNLLRFTEVKAPFRYELSYKELLKTAKEKLRNLCKFLNKEQVQPNMLASFRQEYCEEMEKYHWLWSTPWGADFEA